MGIFRREGIVPHGLLPKRLHFISRVCDLTDQQLQAIHDHMVGAAAAQQLQGKHVDHWHRSWFEYVHHEIKDRKNVRQQLPSN